MTKQSESTEIPHCGSSQLLPLSDDPCQFNLFFCDTSLLFIELFLILTLL